jgi:hypothetical protein
VCLVGGQGGACAGPSAVRRTGGHRGDAVDDVRSHLEAREQHSAAYGRQVLTHEGQVAPPEATVASTTARRVCACGLVVAVGTRQG